MPMTKSEAGKIGAAKSNIIREQQRIKNKEIYYKNPKLCLFCFSDIMYENKINNFCNSSCAASYNNPKRSKQPIRTCLNCKCEIRTPKYCSIKCQKQYVRNQTFILIENGHSLNSSWIKKYLINLHGQKCMADDCAWDFSKKQIMVELEHIDGNYTNNKLENCILLCPNCHSLTSTYKAKNTGNGRHYRRLRYKENKSF